jgi:allantoin racemase
MRIKVINPNSTLSMTEKIQEAAEAVAAPGTAIVAVSPESGPASIEGYYDEAIAAVGVLQEISKGEREGFDGFVIACFGDPGLQPARELARAPVVGIAESAMYMASLVSEGFSIVSMPSRAHIGMERLVQAYGMERKCRKVRMFDFPVLALEEDGFDSRSLIVEECRKALQEDHSDCVLLGCAGMADVANFVTERIGAPAIDGVAAAVKMVEALVCLGLKTCKSGGYGSAAAEPRVAPAALQVRQRA